MIVSNLYLINGIKNYPAYTGDTTEEYAKILVPSNSKEAAEKRIKEENLVNEIISIDLLYKVMEGLDDEKIYKF